MDDNDRRRIIYATIKGNISRLKAYLHAGKDPNLEDDNGASLLCLSAMYLQTRSAILLLKNGANIKAKDVDGQNALFYAAMAKRRNPVIRILASRGCPVNSRDVFGRTPIIPAIIAGDIHNVESLLEHGSWVNIITKDEESPLTFAITWGRHEIAKLLLARGSRINIVSSSGWTPLMYASYYGDERMIRILLRGGAKKDIKDINGRTAQMHANERGHIRCAQLLI